jgi:hypothetical protein
MPEGNQRRLSAVGDAQPGQNGADIVAHRSLG